MMYLKKDLTEIRSEIDDLDPKDYVEIPADLDFNKIKGIDDNDNVILYADEEIEALEKQKELN
jgi:hypothetical protein